MPVIPLNLPTIRIHPLTGSTMKDSHLYWNFDVCHLFSQFVSAIFAKKSEEEYATVPRIWDEISARIRGLVSSIRMFRAKVFAFQSYYENKH